MVDDVLDGVAGNGRMVEDTADDNRVVGWIVVAEQIAGPTLAPAHLRARLHASKKAQVQIFKDRFEIIDASLC